MCDLLIFSSSKPIIICEFNNHVKIDVYIVKACYILIARHIITSQLKSKVTFIMCIIRSPLLFYYDIVQIIECDFFARVAFLCLLVITWTIIVPVKRQYLESFIIPLRWYRPDSKVPDIILYIRLGGIYFSQCVEERYITRNRIHLKVIIFGKSERDSSKHTVWFQHDIYIFKTQKETKKKHVKCHTYPLKMQRCCDYILSFIYILWHRHMGYDKQKDMLLPYG